MSCYSSIAFEGNFLVNDDDKIICDEFSSAIQSLWAATFEMNRLSEGHNVRIAGLSLEQVNANREVFANACAEVCFKIEDVIAEGDLDGPWLLRSLLQTPYPGPQERVSMLSTRAQEACGVLKKLNAKDALEQERAVEETTTPLRTAILSLIWSIAMICKPDHDLYRMIEKKRFYLLQSSKNTRRYGNELLKKSLPEYQVSD